LSRITTRRRLLVAIVLLAAATLLPVEASWSWTVPSVRTRSLPVASGEVVGLPWPSSHLGVQWHGDEDAAIELRWRAPGVGAAGAWSAWQALVTAHDMDDPVNGRSSSGLVPVRDATAVQVRVVSGAADALELVAIDAVHGRRRTMTASGPSGGVAAASIQDPKVGPPPIIGRPEWGADESLRRRDREPVYAPIRRLAVHHTVTVEGSDPAATVRAILAYHTQANGWNDIGYNFLIDSAGRVYEGRWARSYAPGEVPDGENTEGKGVVGAHVSGNNTGTVGIALLGDFTGASPTRAALRSLERVLAWKGDRHDIDLLGETSWSVGTRPTIAGHRDVGQTACPGGRLYELLPTVRWSANHIAASARTSNPTLGYWTLGRDSSLYSFGQSAYHGGSGQVPAPVVSMASTPSGNGYWLLSANGRVSPFGDAVSYGSTEAMRLNKPVVRLEPTPSGLGYWVLAADGGVFSFGDAAFHGSTGSMRLNAPVVSMASTVTGRGYWLLAGDGGVFTFGDAAFHGSTGSMRLNAPVVSMAPAPSGAGYWLQAADGGIFTFGALRFYGSVPGLALAGTANTVQIRITPTGEGYYVMGADGGIFTFGDARFHGSQPGMSGNAPAVDIALKIDVVKTRTPPTRTTTTSTTTLLPTSTTTTTERPEGDG
jgi:hypothetical protein